MMNFQQPFRAFLAFLALTLTLPVWADGTITHFSGPVSILKADGKTLAAAAGTKAVTGDTVITGTKGYARLEMTDGSEMVLRPDSRLKIEAYHFDPAKPADDKSSFSMFQGGLRKITGLIGKRGNKEAYEMKTLTATIGIRGTQYDVRVCAGNCGALADGTYLAVRFGAIQATNSLGSLQIPAGQIAFFPPKAPPVILPRDPGIGFTPPAVIPKLDEKSKPPVQSSASPAEQPSPAATSQPAAPASTPTQSEAKPTSGTPPQGETASNSTTTSPTSPSGQSASPFAAPAANSGPECSIQ